MLTLCYNKLTARWPKASSNEIRTRARTCRHRTHPCVGVGVRVSSAHGDESDEQRRQCSESELHIFCSQKHSVDERLAPRNTRVLASLATPATNSTLRGGSFSWKPRAASAKRLTKPLSAPLSSLPPRLQQQQQQQLCKTVASFNAHLQQQITIRHFAYLTYYNAKFRRRFIQQKTKTISPIIYTIAAKFLLVSKSSPSRSKSDDFSSKYT